MTASVFLVSVSYPNFGRTVADPVTLAEFDPPPEVTRVLPAERPVRVWGTRKGGGNREQYADLAVGDRLLFADEDGYVGSGRVGTKFTTPWISRTFWGYAPMELLYAVEEYREFDLTRATINDALDLDADFRPDGLHRVDDDGLAAALDGRDSIDALIDGLVDGVARG